VFAALALASPGVAADRSWIEKANANPRTASLKNPYEGRAEAAEAGQKMYARYCSACHGKQAEGIGRTPPLHSPTMREAAPGALFWLLRNGNLRRGMPSWSQLPAEQRWQIITYLKTL
jgi:mono/diheme cytochrome c family protein